MGYTHYMYRRVGSEIPADAWAKIRNDAEKLIAEFHWPLWHDYDEPGTTPEVTDEVIWFNGANDDGHETFVLTRKAGEQPDWCKDEPEVFEFCKTACKPYDTVVTAILAVAKEYAPDFIRVSSDGDEDEWQDGLGYAKRVLGRDVSFPVNYDEAP